jgi:hypothetical protein
MMTWWGSCGSPCVTLRAFILGHLRGSGWCINYIIGEKQNLIFMVDSVPWCLIICSLERSCGSVCWFVASLSLKTNNRKSWKNQVNSIRSIY